MTDWQLNQGYYTQTGTVLLRKDGIKNGTSNVLLFMRGLGLRWATAPSISKNRFGGITEPLTWSEYSLYQSPQRLYLHGATIKEDFIALRSSPTALLAALEIYKISAKEIPQNCENNSALKILWGAMQQLCNKINPKLVKYRFIWRLLNNLGIAPSLDICANCGHSLNCGTLSKEGIFCENCWPLSGSCTAERNNCHYCIEIPAKKLREMRFFALSPYNEILGTSNNIIDVDFYGKIIKMLSLYFIRLR